MMHFIQQLRELSGGKPVGFKLCIGHPWEFVAIVKAMLHTRILPDFIVVDGKEGGTGAAPLELSNYMGMPLREGLLFVHNTLVGCGLRDQIKIGASGKIISAFDIASVLVLGADWVNSARGFMFAIGCIQSQSCHTNHCPTGVATQDPLRQKALVVPNKAERVYHFHQNTVKALADMLAAAGVSRPEQLTSHHMLRRITPTEIKVYADIYYYTSRARCCSRRSKASSMPACGVWRRPPVSIRRSRCRRHDGIRNKGSCPSPWGRAYGEGLLATAALPSTARGRVGYSLRTGASPAT